MKANKIFVALIAGASSLMTFAQGGYQDGIDYYNADRFDKAKIILDRTLNDASTDKGQAYYYLGCIDMRNGNAQQAKANFEKGVQNAPNSPYGYIGLGEVALKGGNESEAKKLFEQGLKLDKKNPDVAIAIARAYFNCNPNDLKNIDKYLAMAMKNSKNLAPSAYVFQGDMAAAKGEINDAATFYDQAIIYEEQQGAVNPEAYVKYANIYNNYNAQYAIGKLQELRQKLPTSALAQSELAEKYYDHDMYLEAIDEYGKYMKNPNHFQNDEQRYSQLLYFAGKYPESLEIAQKVLKNDPKNIYMYRMIMVNNSAMRNWAEAVKWGDKLFNTPGVEFGNIDYSTYADALARSGRGQDALAVYEKGYNANPEKNISMLPEISKLYKDTGNPLKAIEIMQKYIDAGKASLGDYYSLAGMYSAYGQTFPEGSAERNDNINKGIALLDQKINDAADSSKGSFYYSRAYMLMARDGQNPTPELMQTLDNMLQAFGDPSKNPDAAALAYQFKIADAMQKNDKAAAREALEMLKTVNPENRNIAKFEEILK